MVQTTMPFSRSLGANMNRLVWPKNTDDNERARRAASHLERDAMFAEFCTLVLIPSLARITESLMSIDPQSVELPRNQGAGQTIEDLLKMSRDARDILSRQKHQPPTERPTEGNSNE